MRRIPVTIAAAMALVATASASAGSYNPALDYVISINDGNAFSLSGTPVSFNVIVPDTGGTVVGFSFEGTLFVNQSGLPGLPGQTQLTITAPDASTYVVGGMPPSASSWDFQSATNSNNVTYNHGPDMLLPDTSPIGTWTFTFARVGGFPSTHQWSNVTITLHSVPAPGALALCGVAAALGRRRRRN